MPGGDSQRIQQVFDRILTLTDQQVKHQLKKVNKDFSRRHKNFKHILLSNFDAATRALGHGIQVSADRKSLFGALPMNASQSTVSGPASGGMEYCQAPMAEKRSVQLSTTTN